MDEEPPLDPLGGPHQGTRLGLGWQCQGRGCTYVMVDHQKKDHRHLVGHLNKQSGNHWNIGLILDPEAMTKVGAAQWTKDQSP